MKLIPEDNLIKFRENRYFPIIFFKEYNDSSFKFNSYRDRQRNLPSFVVFREKTILLLPLSQHSFVFPELIFKDKSAVLIEDQEASVGKKFNKWSEISGFELILES